MFLRTNRSQTGYDRYGAQRAGGPYLMLFSLDRSRELRAAVRSVQLRQLGHSMMGRVKVAGVDFTLSGPYGHDGLPLDPGTDAVWSSLVPVPHALAEAFWHGGGHNSTGSEAPDMRAWALANLDRLQKAGRLPRKKSTQKRHGPKPGFETKRLRRAKRKAAKHGLVLRGKELRALAFPYSGTDWLEGRAKSYDDYRRWAAQHPDDPKYREGTRFDPKALAHLGEYAPSRHSHARFMAQERPKLPNPRRRKRR